MHRIIQGDALKILPTIDEEVDLVLTDPPYFRTGMDYGNCFREMQSEDDYRVWSETWFYQVMEIAPCVVFTPGTYSLPMWFDIKKPIEIMSWESRNSGTRNHLGGFLNVEPILVYGNPEKRVSTNNYYDPISRQRGVDFHPCPKPLGLFRDLIHDFTNKGDLILDPFVGSGTTVMAAKRLGRQAIGIEQNPEYCELARQRIAKVSSRSIASVFG